MGEPEYTVVDLPVAQIVPGDNDRQTFEEQALQDLARSIHIDGLIQPITVRPWRDGLYQIVAGERRFRAISQLLKWETVPAIVRELSDEEAAGIMLAENVHRAELSPIEEARAYQKRMEAHGWSAAETGRRAKVSDRRVRSRLKLLDLAPDIQALVASDQLPIGFGEELARLDEAHQRIVVAWLSKQRSRPTKATFSAYVSKVYENMAQASIFDMGLMLQAEVVQAIAESKDGRLWQALPGVQGLPDLPAKQGSMASVLDHYIVTLLREGHQTEAVVVIDLWRKLQRANYAVMAPLDSQALQYLATTAV